MATDIAEAIVKKAVQTCEHRLLKLKITLCHDNDEFNPNTPIDPDKTYSYFRKIPFEIDCNIGSFECLVGVKKEIYHEDFVFFDFDDAFKMLLYQYILHASYIKDITVYDIILLDIQDPTTSKQLSLCYPISLSEIPLNELHTITSDIIDKIYEPIMVVFNGWVKMCERI
jgi:hypothetical protein